MMLEIVSRAYAVTGDAVSITNPIGADSFGDVVETVIGAVVKISAPIAVLMILVGAFQIMTASGNEEGVTNGKNTIKYAVIGFAIVVASQVAVDIIQSILE